jgi:hypothetical protein
MTYTEEQIKGLLPHRAPFLFAREVDVVEPGKLGRARIQLTRVDNYWQGDAGLSPTRSADVLLLESAAQVFGVVLASGTEAQLATGGKTAAEGKHLLLGFDNCVLIIAIFPATCMRNPSCTWKSRWMVFSALCTKVPSQPAPVNVCWRAVNSR